MHMMKITGEISENNQLEFKQTIEFIENQITKMNIEGQLMPDATSANKFHFHAYFNSKKQLEQFRNDDLYKAAIGAFKVLGIYEGTSILET